jgi:hypothetical protein
MTSEFLAGSFILAEAVIAFTGTVKHHLSPLGGLPQKSFGPILRNDCCLIGTFSVLGFDWKRRFLFISLWQRLVATGFVYFNPTFVYFEQIHVISCSNFAF